MEFCYLWIYIVKVRAIKDLVIIVDKSGKIGNGLIKLNMRIQVTEEDIKKGVTRSSVCCPIANAVNRTLNTFCWVDQDEIIVKDNSYPLPLIAKDFILKFDYLNPVEPFTFNLDIQ